LTSSKRYSNRTFAKSAEIGIGCVLFAYIFRDLTSLSTPMADALGVFVAAIIIYWVPPTSRTGFLKWVITSLAAAIFLFMVGTVVTGL
jgi:hypothetical protein